MNLITPVLLVCILAPLLLAAIGWYALRIVREQRSRTEVLERELAVREHAIEYLAAATVPTLAESVRRGERPTVALEIPPGLENSRFAQCLHWIAERVSEELVSVQTEARESTLREDESSTRQAVAAAEQAVRAEAESSRSEIESTAREATSAAVRSFGTSVVSLGADISQVVSAALRQHRDDSVYETLTRIDHTVQQMIRQAQSYVIVCGGLPGRRWPAQPLTDVIGGAIGRVRDYLRVRSNQLDRTVISRAVEPLVHTMASLIDNALRYSPPTSFVDVSFQEGHHGVTVIIDDAGVRMNAEQMEEARQVLSGERSVDIHELGPAPKVGFPGIAALARRYGFTVYIDGPNAYGGMRAMVYVPETLLVAPKNDDDANPMAAPSNPRELAAVGSGIVSPSLSAPPMPGTGSALSNTPTMSAGHSTGSLPQSSLGPVNGGGGHGSGPTSVGGSPMTGGNPVVPSDRIVSPGGYRGTTVSEVSESSEYEYQPTVHDITRGGLPKRRRRAEIAAAAGGDHAGSRSGGGQARPDIAAAWQSGSKSGRAAASEHTEGMTS